MRLSLLYLGMVAAFCALSAKADTSAGALPSVEAALVAAVLKATNISMTATSMTTTPAASAAIATSTSSSAVSTSTTSAASPAKRSFVDGQRYNLGNILAKRSDYITLTNGTDPAYASAALQAPGYLTYKVISNTTSYSVAKAACLNYCDSVTGCIAANMYQEINNPLLDLVFSEKSNRKCALYSTVPTLSEMTNKGGQTLYGKGNPANYIINSAVFYKDNGPATPPGYALGFGPSTEAVSLFASGFLDWQLVASYDPALCANICNDTNHTGCVFFNMWTADIQSRNTATVCTFYSVAKSASDATVSSVDVLIVTNSRGYSRST